MKKKYFLPVLLAVTGLLAGCGADNGDYSSYVTLGDYKNLSAVLSVEAVSDEDLQAYEKEQLSYDVTYQETKGPVKEEQLVEVSLLAKEGEEVVYDFSEDGYELTVGQQEFGAEVDEALLGCAIGDEVDLTVTYDDEFEDALLCGKDISYHIEIRKVSDVIYPELTNEYLKENFGESSLEAWEQTLREELLSERQAEATENMRDDLVEQAVDGAQISGYPKSLYKAKREAVQQDYQSYADMFGCSLEDIYEMLQVSEDDLEQQYLDETYRTMVLSVIRQQENITLSDEQLQEKLEEYASENEYDSVEDLLQDYSEDDLTQYFLDKETKDFLEEHAKITVSES